MKFDKFKFTTVNATKCITTGCNNYPQDSQGMYCRECRKGMGM